MLLAFDLINSEKTYIQSQIDYIKAKANQLSNIVAIHQAAGGVVNWHEYQQTD